MRHIPYSGRLPDPTWVEAAKQKAQKIETYATMEEKKKFLQKDSTAKAWGAFKDWLLSFSHDKCWFSDTTAAYFPFEIEHFRPKSKVKEDNGTESEGYWWLAFEWKNFRICGKLGNSKKGSLFPLSAGCSRATCAAELPREQPILIDPTRIMDVRLVGFNLEGEMIPSSEATTPHHRMRIEKTRDIMNLDLPKLVALRREVLQECVYNVEHYLEALGHLEATNDPAWETAAEHHGSLLRKMLDPRTQLSSVARYYITMRNDIRLSCFLG
ncbi:hypothetical protein [Deinococcus roseus]|uniref:HNH nuclease domain-containing protein n=1 Tax=Deinococcus roseus TaxID=392414 RepID=A0ABQ2DJH5_9DEIO|nr:hypothetical protein [Deinococcus roseus]GGJ59804.1 hypothetical protein GCM10008938_52430 [Deinococcus roseus]